MRSYVLGTALLVSLTAPALAEEFYIVQNPTTKKCTVVTEKPTTTTTTTVVGGAILRATYEGVTKEPIPNEHIDLLLALRHKERERRCTLQSSSPQ